MDEAERQKLEQTPECIESKIACDLAMIPVIGVLFYVIFENIASFKLGSEDASKSYWLREGMRRLWCYTGKSLVLGFNLIMLGVVIPWLFNPAYCDTVWFVGTAVFLGMLFIRSFRRVVSLMIVCTFVMALISAIFTPSYCHEAKYSNSNSAQAMLKSIVTAQAAYTTQYRSYAPSLAVLVFSGILNVEALAGCNFPADESQIYCGYIFEMTAGRKWSATNFYVRCRPEAPTAGTNCYATDTTGRIVTTESYQ